jgi:aldose sugar dehydrogenase
MLYRPRKRPKTLSIMHTTRLIAPLIIGPLIIGAGTSKADAMTFTSQHHEVQVTTIVEGLEHPWGMAFLPDGAILVTERPGRLRIVRDGVLDADPISGVPDVVTSGQGGLLDIALHPEYETNGLVYFSHSALGPDGPTTAVSRGRLVDAGLGNTALEDTQTIFVTQAGGTTGRHFGSRIVFDRDGYLYLTVGDRGEMHRAQDPRDHAGTTLRLHDDGSVPGDNPFVGDATALPEIFTYGNRNAQGMAVNPQTGAVWQNEHGPRGGDEINLIQPGLNYGWPEVTHGIDYSGAVITEHQSAPGMEDPLKHWTPSIAPSGMAFYTGDAFPEWQGDIFIGALAGQHLARIRFDDTNEIAEERMMDGFGWRIRDVRDGPDGYLYLLIDAGNAPLIRLEPAG